MEILQANGGNIELEFGRSNYVIFLRGVYAEICQQQTKILDLFKNQIGDPGATALAEACARGALPQCTFLNLRGNQIGDAGVSALASACASGALPSLKKIVVNSEHECHPQLIAVCKRRGIEIA